MNILWSYTILAALSIHPSTTMDIHRHQKRQLSHQDFIPFITLQNEEHYEVRYQLSNDQLQNSFKYPYSRVQNYLQTSTPEAETEEPPSNVVYEIYFLPKKPKEEEREEDGVLYATPLELEFDQGSDLKKRKLEEKRKKKQDAIAKLRKGKAVMQRRANGFRILRI